MPQVPVVMRPTEHAGHARDLAREAAQTGHPLIVSVSGDGGYNEVVDGVMQAGNDHAVCAVKAAGNANDHRRATAERPLVDAVVAGKVRRIDLLRLTIPDGDNARSRYAHSYIGMGLTPVVAIDLEKGGKGSFKEIVSVIRTFAKFRPFTIQLEGGGRRRFDSLLFANIAEMAKYATLSETGRPDDGRFEVIMLPHTAKWRILGVAIRAATRGLGPQPTAEHYAFTTLKPTPPAARRRVADPRRRHAGAHRHRPPRPGNRGLSNTAGAAFARGITLALSRSTTHQDRVVTLVRPPLPTPGKHSDQQAVVAAPDG
jgi:diacylglycerol kinase family enzyme